jgi:hypothetical protein
MPRSRPHPLISRAAGVICTVLMGLAASTACAADGPTVGPADPPPLVARLLAPHFTLDAPAETATLYATGERVETAWQQVWRPMCGSDLSEFTAEDLADIATAHAADVDALEPGEAVIIDQAGGVATGGINIVFSLSTSVPAAAYPAFTAAEAYLESQFSDPITITVSVSFQSMGSGVLGSTGSYYTSASWNTSRAGLATGMDATDTIQTSLPTTSTLPVRYNGATSTVTNEDRVFWTRANYRATVGAVSGTAASMTYNTNFSWDWNPANGVSAGTYSFQDVIIHEVGHSLGFTSGADFRINDLEALDVYRFQRTDGAADYNPDTTAEFQLRARLVDNNMPNDDHNSDLIAAEYRMADGSPYQASHFREQSPSIGIMDPALGWGQTFYPSFYRTPDLAMFDAIGYDR